jgi:hypothetical protein
MGRKHRLICIALTLTAAAGSAAGGCSDKKTEEVEKRRELLVPQDLHAKRAAAEEALRIMDAEGNLLPSTTRVAGVLLPRGVSVVSAYEYDWYCEGKVPLRKLDAYLRAHLVIGEEGRTATGRVELFQAKPTDLPDAKGVYVSFYEKAGRSDMVRMYIRTPRPVPDHFPTPAEVQAQMEARANHAD